MIVPLKPIFVQGAAKYGPPSAGIESKEDELEENAEETKDTAVLHTTQDKEPTLMDKLGGAPALKVAVDEFYKRILADPDLAIFFEGTSMTKLKMHQLSFMKIAFTKISDDLDVPKMMKEKHAHLFDKGLNAVHFDRVAGHFVDTLESLDVSAELVDECVSVIAPLRTVFEYGQS